MALWMKAGIVMCMWRQDQSSIDQGLPRFIQEEVKPRLQRDGEERKVGKRSRKRRGGGTRRRHIGGRRSGGGEGDEGRAMERRTKRAGAVAHAGGDINISKKRLAG